MATTNMDDPWDVIVIGAGLAGMTAAYRILKVQSNARILVLEAKDRIGGRVLAKEMDAANGKGVWDLGGQFIGRKQLHVLWLMKEFDITHYVQETGGTKFMQMNDGKIHKYDNTPPISMAALLDLANISRIMENMSKTVPLDDPRKAKNADDWDGITVDAFLKKKMWTKKGREFVEGGMKAGFGCGTKSISLLTAMCEFAASGSNLEESMGTSEGSAQEWKIKGGALQLCERIQDVVGKDNVLLGEPVSKIDQSDKDIVRVSTATGKEFRCKYVINAAPLHCSVDMAYVPKKPISRIELARYSPMGHLFKFIITYKKAFWTDKGYSGDIFISQDRAATENSPLNLVMDASTPDGNPALFGLYANCEYWGDKSDEECKAAVLSALAEYFGDEAKEPLDFMHKDWTAEPYNGGCSGNVSMPGAISYFHDGCRETFDRVHWAGSESATAWSGYMDGAIQTGIRASDQVLEKLWPTLQKDDLLKQLNPWKQ